MPKWEYKLLEFEMHISPVLTMARWGVKTPGEKKAREGMDKVAEYMTELGAEGWELVTISTGTDQHGIITKGVAFFKRPAIG